MSTQRNDKGGRVMREGWTYKKLGEVCNIFNGNSINADYKKKHFYGVTGGLPFIATKDVSTTGEIDYENGVRIPNNDGYKIAPANSVFICAEGGSAGKKFAYIEQDVCFGNKLFCLNPKTKSLIGKHVYYYIQSEVFKEQFYSLLTGLIGGVSAKKFQSIEIPLPPLSEQQKIVSRLDSAFAKIDALKANAKKRLDDAKALFQKALEKAMEPKEWWEEKKIGDLFKTYAGGTPLKSGKNYYEGGTIPWIRSGEVCQKYINNCELYITEDGMKNSSAKYYPVNTILVAMYGATAAQVGILKFEATSNQAVCGILPREDFVPEYIYYWFVNIQKELASQAQGGAQPNLSQIKIKGVLFSYPPLSEQQAIVAQLDQLSEKVKRLQEIQEKTIKECDALKQAILREVFE